MRAVVLVILCTNKCTGILLPQTCHFNMRVTLSLLCPSIVRDPTTYKGMIDDDVNVAQLGQYDGSD